MSTKRPADALAAWRSFLRLREGFESRTRPRLDALEREIAERLRGLEEGERDCVAEQAAELARVRGALGRDARFVAGAPAFRAWAEGLAAGPESPYGPRPLGPDPARWSLFQGKGVLALRGARSYEADDYDDERDFVAERVAVSASLGRARGEIAFTACRRYGPLERFPCEPSDVLDEAAEAVAAWLPPAPVPGREGLAYEVAAVAIFCAPMLLAEPASVRAPAALGEALRAAQGGSR
ncbi:MAG TPA: hypothetical protein VFS43_44055 [Polyangiaceae bacterium]|nr:hypothetical protein [Polyangiaceae bacterium]